MDNWNNSYYYCGDPVDFFDMYEHQQIEALQCVPPMGYNQLPILTTVPLATAPIQPTPLEYVERNLISQNHIPSGIPYDNSNPIYLPPSNESENNDMYSHSSTLPFGLDPNLPTELPPAEWLGLQPVSDTPILPALPRGGRANSVSTRVRTGNRMSSGRVFGGTGRNNQYGHPTDMLSNQDTIDLQQRNMDSETNVGLDRQGYYSDSSRGFRGSGRRRNGGGGNWGRGNRGGPPRGMAVGRNDQYPNNLVTGNSSGREERTRERRRLLEETAAFLTPQTEGEHRVRGKNRSENVRHRQENKRNRQDNRRNQVENDTNQLVSEPNPPENVGNHHDNLWDQPEAGRNHLEGRRNQAENGRSYQNVRNQQDSRRNQMDNNARFKADTWRNPPDGGRKGGGESSHAYGGGRDWRSGGEGGRNYNQGSRSNNMLGDRRNQSDSWRNRKEREEDSRDKKKKEKDSGQQGLSKKNGSDSEVSSVGKENEANRREKLEEQLRRGNYECMVCCDLVRQRDSIWSCSNCFHVFHLRCIKQWARTSRDDGGWRCPACQTVREAMPYDYLCFCGKMKDPEWNRRDTPHSCGEVCGRGHDIPSHCVHNCTLLCHPGPCSPCSVMATRNCECGKTSQVVICGRSQALLCGTECEKILNCGVHKCSKLCHEGPCGNCEVMVKQVCHCGKNERTIVCDEISAGIEVYACETQCGRFLDCKNHKCTALCHPSKCKPCDLMPKLVTKCPCGKTDLVSIEGAVERKSCLDPIPTCGKICEKVLSCGQPGKNHLCKEPCHEGPCPPCPLTTTVRCRCGNMNKEISCSELTTKADDARCNKKCNKKRSCWRHKCLQLCCIDLDHICPLICNHNLSCGLHKCEEPCHRGNCLPCWRASFEELHCECGASVMFPPIPCGASPPECQKLCSRPHPCTHVPNHKCHSLPQCPPCTALTERYCHGNHELRKNVPCHQTEISCGRPCGKDLPCGRHKCIQLCHKGSCTSIPTSSQHSNSSTQWVCKQPCTTPRSLCGHPCGVACHDGPCPDSPCRETVRVTCSCGHRSTTRACSENATEYQQMAVALLASKMVDMQMGHSVDLRDLAGSASSRKESLKTLECNDECKLIERNRRLALCLQIRNPDLTGKIIPRYSDFMKQWAKKDAVFVQMVHDRLTELVQLAKQSKQKSRSYMFKVMGLPKRQFVHEYCEHFGCEAQSYDEEPNRNVVATALRDKSWLPSLSLLEVIKREAGSRKVPVPLQSRPSSLASAAKPATSSNFSTLSNSSSSSRAEREKSTILGEPSSSSNSATGNSVPATPQVAVADAPSPVSKPVIDYFDYTGD